MGIIRLQFHAVKSLNPIPLVSQSSSMTGVWWYQVQCAFIGGDCCRSIGEFNES
jgi:hypothetical protein